MSATEINNFVNRNTVEHAWGTVMRIRREWKDEKRVHPIVEQALRAARARDEKLLVALDKSAEVLARVAEEQTGRTVRDGATEFSHRVEPTESAFMRAAYVSVDQGTPIDNYGWIYAIAGIAAGIIH